MSSQHRPIENCAVCNKSFAARDLIPSSSVREGIADAIKRDHPSWSGDSRICRADLNQYRSRFVHALLESEKGELTALEHEVLSSLSDNDVLAKNLATERADRRTLGERLADRIAAFGGSWTFLISFFVFILAWVGMNSLVLIMRPFDPYPFILLNLLLSCLAAVQAPIIMMSQNRQEAKDRLRAEHDYQVNLKAELEIRHLHEKMDHLLSHQWERLVAIQELQIELLAELGKRR